MPNPPSQTIAIPPDFLPPTPPSNTTTHALDFSQTNPPIPKYKHHFATVIDNILTPSECKELIRLAESVGPWERAMINLGGGRQALATDERNCGRMILDSGELAGRLFSRLRPLLEQYGLGRIENNLRVTGLRGRGKVYELTRLNERLRFLKYVGGEYFRPHWDGMYTDPGSGECSLYTIQLYLNGDGEQDLGELQREMGREKEKAGENEKEKWTNADVNAKLLGGATSFIPRFEEAETQVRVFPKTGSVLVFQQSDLLHGGDPVVRGSKFTVRTDVMYRVVEC